MIYNIIKKIQFQNFRFSPYKTLDFYYFCCGFFLPSKSRAPSRRSKTFRKTRANTFRFAVMTALEVQYSISVTSPVPSTALIMCRGRIGERIMDRKKATPIQRSLWPRSSGRVTTTILWRRQGQGVLPPCRQCPEKDTQKRLFTFPKQFGMGPDPN